MTSAAPQPTFFWHPPLLPRVLFHHPLPPTPFTTPTMHNFSPSASTASSHSALDVMDFVYVRIDRHSNSLQPPAMAFSGSCSTNGRCLRSTFRELLNGFQSTDLRPPPFLVIHNIVSLLALVRSPIHHFFLSKGGGGRAGGKGLGVTVMVCPYKCECIFTSLTDPAW